MGVRDMVRRIEAAVIQWLDSVGISAYGKVSAPGVYVTRGGTEAKIAALGLKVRNGCTYHGLAVNIAMDLAPFADIDPCGYPGLARDAACCVRRHAHGGKRGRGTGADPRSTLEPTMTIETPPPAATDNAAGVKHQGAAKTARIPIKVVAAERLPKPEWIRVRASSSPRFNEIKKILRENSLHTVCEEASCPNIGECFSKGTATFMIMGDICTRRCPFCDVGHGRPLPLDADEPVNLAKTIAALKLRYVVITSVDRDDLRDGGAQHFVDCIRAVRAHSPSTQIEVLVPDFRGRLDRALSILRDAPPDVMNHNLETVPRLYKQARPGSDYAHSLTLLRDFKALFPDLPTKSGLMVGLGETDDEILAVMRDMRAHHIDMLTLGQYLQPTQGHLPVLRYVHPDTFAMFEREAYAMGFRHAAVGALVRSSYHADKQAEEVLAEAP